MKKSFQCRILSFGTALLFSTSMILPAFAAESSNIKDGPGAQAEVSISSDSAESLEAQIALGPGYAANQALTKSSESIVQIPGGPGSQTDSLIIEMADPGEYLGSFESSGYCSCEKCSGGYALTYSGTVPQAKHTIAADLDLFPLGTRLVIDGIVYTVEDMGGGINGNRLDIYFASHEDALAFGLQTIDVYAPKQ